MRVPVPPLHRSKHIQSSQCNFRNTIFNLVMKKFIFASLLMGACAMMASAQTEFRHITFDQALQAAQQEEKLVFIDFFTTWCGPCKMMSTKVFPEPAVGEYMNKTFIPIKLDAEAEGQELAKKFGVRAYPTYVILNAKGEKVADFAGAMQGDKFIDKLQSQLDPERSPERIAQRYQSGERTPQVVNAYAMQFMEQQKEKEGFEVINNYWDSLSDAQRLAPENSFLFTVYTIELKDPKATYMKENLEKFDPATRDAVKARLSQLMSNEVRKYFSGYYWKEGKYTPENFNALKTDIANLNLNKNGYYDVIYQFIETRPQVDDMAYLTFIKENYNKLDNSFKDLVFFNLSRLLDVQNNPALAAEVAKFIRENLATMSPVSIQFAGRTLGEIEK